MNTKEAAKLIRKTLKEKTGKSWSVRMGRGTAGAWISVSSPPRRRVNHEVNKEIDLLPWDERAARIQDGELPYIEIDPPEGKKGMYTPHAEQLELKELFGDIVGIQGISISPNERDFLIDKITGKIDLCPRCHNYKEAEQELCTDCQEYKAQEERYQEVEPVVIQPQPYKPIIGNGKIPAVKFEILWSEWADVDFPTFWNWQDFKRQCKIIANDHAHIFGVKKRNCYFKTKFRVTFADGETYEGRLDIHGHPENGDSDPQEHVRQSMEFYAGTHRPAWMNEQQWNGHLKRNKENQEDYIEFLETYEV